MSLKKCIGIQEVAKRAFNGLTVLRRDIDSANDKQLTQGIKNYNAIVPVNASQGRFGFFRTAVKDNRTDFQDGWFSYHYHDLSKKIARVYVQNDNQMHQTPVVSKTKWVVQFERGQITRIGCMGWTFTDDPITRYLYKFDSLEHALAYCQRMGVGYQVQYPRYRYTVKKSYADNFKWKGFPKDDADS